MANYSSQYVGQTLVYLNGTFEECRYRECNLGNLICDAMVRVTVQNTATALISRPGNGRNRRQEVSPVFMTS